MDQVVALGLVQQQGIRDGLQDVVGDAGQVAAFQTGVVLDADPGEEGDLGAAQPGNAAVRPGRELHLVGADLRAS